MASNGVLVSEIRDAAGVLTGYIAGFDGSEGVWSPAGAPDAAVNALKEFITGYVQTCRQDAEMAGVDVNGNVFSTDISSQVKYVGIMVYASMDKSYSGTWKTVNNGFVTLNAATVIVMCIYVMAYIQVCFAWEQYILAQVAAATTVQQLQAIDLETGRPSGQLPPSVVAGLQATIGALGTGALQGTSLAVSGTSTSQKLKGGSATPEVTAGAGAGSTAIVSLAPGSTDTAGQISVVAGGTIASVSGTVIVTVTFAEPYETVPFVTISAANLAAGCVACAPFVTATTSGFTLSVSNNEGLTAVTHLFNYMAIA